MSAPVTPAIRRALSRIPVILEQDGYGTDDGVAAELGIEHGEVRTAIGILYRRRRLDRCDGYLVLPASRGPVTVPARAA